MTNIANNICADISMHVQKLEEVTSLKYVGATHLCEEGTRCSEICLRIASAMSVMARLNRIWKSNTISFASKFKMYKSLITSILLYGCETWTLLVNLRKGFRLLKPSA